MRLLALSLNAIRGGSAAVCVMAALAVLAVGCAGEVGRFGNDRGPSVYLADSSSDHGCAWFGDTRGDVLYFGQAAFWHSFRRGGGDPRADLETSGPQRVGRFDLARERFLAPLDVGAGNASGTWDVFAHRNGRVYFSTFFDLAGYVEPSNGRAVRLPALGTGLNELAAGPDDDLVATRYASEGGGSGSVVHFGPDGELRAEHWLTDEPGVRALAKSVSFDPVRRTLWVNTDRIDAAGELVGHDARVLGVGDGGERLRIDHPELHFVHFDARGHGVFAWRDGARLTLRLVGPDRKSVV